MNKKAETERWSGTDREGERGSTSGPLERERERERERVDQGKHFRSSGIFSLIFLV